MSNLSLALAGTTAAACTIPFFYHFYYNQQPSEPRAICQPTVAELTSKYNLQPHPEGGYFAETYRSAKTVEAEYGTRNASTAIYFLITPGCVSRFHKIAADEMWHFYIGGPMTVVEISTDGTLTKTTLGQDVLQEQKVQHLVKAGTWFGSFPNKGTTFSFVGCTVAPGFDFCDFQLGSRSKLIDEYPQHFKDIEMLTEGLP